MLLHWIHNILRFRAALGFVLTFCGFVCIKSLIKLSMLPAPEGMSRRSWLSWIPMAVVRSCCGMMSSSGLRRVDGSCSVKILTCGQSRWSKSRFLAPATEKSQDDDVNNYKCESEYGCFLRFHNWSTKPITIKLCTHGLRDTEKDIG